jgi:hypothetical protein
MPSGGSRLRAGGARRWFRPAGVISVSGPHSWEAQGFGSSACNRTPIDLRGAQGFASSACNRKQSRAMLAHLPASFAFVAEPFERTPELRGASQQP